MKNIHILPTDKASRLQLQMNGTFHIENEQFIALRSYQNIYITSDEEFNEYTFAINLMVKVESVPNSKWGKKIILTTDQDLIKDGVQSIDDEFLQWFVNNPSCESVEVQDWYSKFLSCCRSKKECYCNKKRIIIPKEEPNKTHYLDELPNMDREVLAKMWESAMPKLESKQETLEEATQRELEYFHESVRGSDFDLGFKTGMVQGAVWQDEKDMWKTVSEETPPIHIELLVQSPSGINHLASWRPAYNIFTCQVKSESSFGWKWKTIK